MRIGNDAYDDIGVFLALKPFSLFLIGIFPWKGS